jgi:hypothetical protein
LINLIPLIFTPYILIIKPFAEYHYKIIKADLFLVKLLKDVTQIFHFPESVFCSLLVSSNFLIVPFPFLFNPFSLSRPYYHNVLVPLPSSLSTLKASFLVNQIEHPSFIIFVLEFKIFFEVLFFHCQL